MEKIFSFIYSVLLLTFNHLIILFGFIFIAGLILYFLSRITRRVISGTGIPRAELITAWIGTPVHELGHALFCIIFGHKITEIKLFSPDSSDGTLGYVRHSYNKKNIYHLTGNFFIGIGPVISGTAAIYFLMLILLPNHNQIVNQITDSAGFNFSIGSIKENITSSYKLLIMIFDPKNFREWEFWVFIYLTLSIATHIELSPADLKGMWSGLIVIILLLIFINILAVIFSADLTAVFSATRKYTGRTTGLFLFAASLSFINLIFWLIISSLKKVFIK